MHGCGHAGEEQCASLRLGSKRDLGLDLSRVGHPLAACSTRPRFGPVRRGRRLRVSIADIRNLTDQSRNPHIINLPPRIWYFECLMIEARAVSAIAGRQRLVLQIAEMLVCWTLPNTSNTDCRNADICWTLPTNLLADGDCLEWQYNSNATYSSQPMSTSINFWGVLPVLLPSLNGRLPWMYLFL